MTPLPDETPEAAEEWRPVVGHEGRYEVSSLGRVRSLPRARTKGRDTVRHGRHPERNKTHCPSGHPYDEANTYTTSEGWRKCRECHRLYMIARRAA